MSSEIYKIKPEAKLMNKIMVVYESQYGATKQYAELIAKQLSADIYNADNVSEQQLKLYDTIIWGGGIYAGRINGINKLERILKNFAGKQIIIFSVGVTPIDATERLQKVRDNSLAPAFQEGISFFHFNCGVNFLKLSLIHRIMLATERMLLLLKPKKSLTESRIKYLQTYGENNQIIDESAVIPLVHAATQ